MKLKILSIYLTVIIVVSFALGIMFLVIGGEYNFENSAEMKDFNVNQTQSMGIEGINKISISGDSMEIKVIPTNEVALTAKLYGYVKTDSEMEPQLQIYNEEGHMKIRIERKNFFSIFNSENLMLDVYVPNEYSSEISISTASGDISIEDATLKELECDSASGNIQIKNLKSAELDANTASGDITITDSEVKSIDIDTASGNTKVAGLVLGEIDISSASGDINLLLSELSGNIDADSASGNIQINVPANTEFILDYNTASGNLKNTFAMQIEEADSHSFRGSTENAEYEINVDTSSGDLNIWAYNK